MSRPCYIRLTPLCTIAGDQGIDLATPQSGPRLPGYPPSMKWIYYIHICIYLYIYICKYIYIILYIFILYICCNIYNIEMKNSTGQMALKSTLEATHGQMDVFLSQLQYKCHQNRVAYVGDWLKICPWDTSRVVLNANIYTHASLVWPCCVVIVFVKSFSSWIPPLQSRCTATSALPAGYPLTLHTEHWTLNPQPSTLHSTLIPKP